MRTRSTFRFIFWILLLFPLVTVAQSVRELPLPQGPYHCDDIIPIGESVVSHQIMNDTLFIIGTDDATNWDALEVIPIDSSVTKSRMQQVDDVLFLSYSTGRDSQLYILASDGNLQKWEGYTGPKGCTVFESTTRGWVASGGKHTYLSTNEGEDWMLWKSDSFPVQDIHEDEDGRILFVYQNCLQVLSPKDSLITIPWDGNVTKAVHSSYVVHDMIFAWSRRSLGGCQILAAKTDLSEFFPMTLPAKNDGGQHLIQSIQYKDGTMYVGTRDGLWLTSDFGVTWTKIDVPFDTEEFILTDSIWYCAGMNGFFWSSDFGGQWLAGNKGKVLSSLYPGRGIYYNSMVWDEEFLVLYKGEITYFTEDNGETWVIRTPISWVSDYYKRGQLRIMVSKVSNRASISHDGGWTWDDIDSIPQNLLFLVAQGDTLISEDQLSFDGGRSWQHRGDGYFITQAIYCEEGFYGLDSGRLVYSSDGSFFSAVYQDSLDLSNVRFLDNLSNEEIMIQAGENIYTKASNQSFKKNTNHPIPLSKRHGPYDLSCIGDNCVLLAWLPRLYFSSDRGHSWEGLLLNTYGSRTAVEMGFGAYILTNYQLPSGTYTDRLFFHEWSLTSASTTAMESDPMTLIPNPATEGSTVFCPQLRNTSGELIMIGAEGANHILIHQNGKVQLPSDTPPGVYTLMSVSENEVYQGRLVLH